jgi:antitoxin MazE
MTTTELNIKHWGNSLGVRLPAAVARAAKLHADQRVRVAVDGKRVVIEPVATSPMSLAQRLSRYDADRHGGEAMVTERVGAERW